MPTTFGYEEDEAPHTTRVHHKFEVPSGISLAFFDEIVEFYQERGSEDLDIGFKKEGQGMQWLSSRRLVTTLFLDVVEEEGVVRNLQQLADALQARSGTILGGLT